MRFLRTVGAALACVAALSAQGLTGRWEARWSPVDEARKMVLAIQQDGNKITGYVLQPSGTPTTIAEGSVNGNSITIFVERPGRGGAAPTRVNYTATLQGEKLVLSMPGRGGQPQVREFTRVSTAVPEPPPAPKPRIALGEYKPVPSNGLAKTPPMGWNSWNKFAERVTDKDVREIADAMVTSGMKDVGYMYVNIDDTWSLGRDANGNITSNSKFPDMKALADYVHSKGLKLGIYTSPGPKTCAGYEASYGHEAQDAKQFAAWGIDYLKYDWCSAADVYISPQSDPVKARATMEAAYAVMGDALLKSGRNIVYSLCQGGMHNVDEWGAKVGGNLWRTTIDIYDRWQSMVNIGFNQQIGREKFAGPGHWNDPDMLEIGNGGMTDTEYQTHMSLWCLLAAPLLAGNDLRTMTPATRDILTNKEVITIDQDKLGKQALRVFPAVPPEELAFVPAQQGNSSKTGGEIQVFARPLADGGHAVGLFNLGAAPAKVTAKWSDLDIKGPHKVRDLWKHEDLGAKTGEFSAEVPSHGVVMIKIAK